MKISKILMTGSIMALSASASYAATDGSLGATSNGTSAVSLEISELVQITLIDDLVLDNGSGGAPNTYEPGSGDVSFTTDVCVHYNNATGVDLTLDSANTPLFRMADAGLANFITYTVGVDEAGGAIFVAHAEGATVRYGAMASTTLGCGGPNTTIQAIVTDTGVPLGVPNGSYTDTMALTVAPNP